MTMKVYDSTFTKKISFAVLIRIETSALDSNIVKYTENMHLISVKY